MADTDDKGTPQPEASPADQKAEQKAEEKGVRSTATREGPCTCVIKIAADADYLKKRYEEQLVTLRKEMTLPGFRRGRAPRGLVEARFGKRVRTEALSAVVTEAYGEATEQNNLMVVAEVESPNLEELAWKVGDPLEVQFKCEVLPDIEVKEEHYKGVTIEVPELKITDEMFEAEMKRFMQQLASWQKLEKGGVDWEDYVEANVTATGPDDDTERFSRQVGFAPRDERIGPFTVEGIKGAIMDAKRGQTIEMQGKLPEDTSKLPKEFLELAEFAGKTMKLRVEIKDVYRQNVPEINDELAKKLNMKDVAELHSFVRERLQRRLEGQKQEALEYAVLDAVLANVPFELPPSLVERATVDEQKRLMIKAMRMGTTREQAAELARDNVARSRSTAERSLKATYLLRKIADQQRIYVLDEEVQEQVRALAARQGWSERRTERYMEENDLTKSLRSDLREAKAVKSLLESAKTNEIPADEFYGRVQRKVMGAGAPEAEAEPEAEKAASRNGAKAEKKTEKDQ